MATSPIGRAGYSPTLEPEASRTKARQSLSTDNLAPTENAVSGPLAELQRKRPDAESSETKRPQVASSTIKSEQIDSRSGLPVESKGKKFQNIKELAEHELSDGSGWDIHSYDWLSTNLKSVKENGSYEVCAKILSSLGVSFKHPPPDATTGTNKELIDRSEISDPHKSIMHHFGRWLEKNQSKSNSLSEFVNLSRDNRNYQVSNWLDLPAAENPYGTRGSDAVNAFLRAFGKAG